MQTWKKITIALGVILILIAGYLYLRGASTAPSPGSGAENLIFPFESGGDGFFGDDGDLEEDREQSNPASPRDLPQLWQVSNGVVAGSGWVTRGSREEIWFVQRSNGHVFASTPERRENTRITNTTIPQVRETLIAPDGDYVIFRYLNEAGEIKTYAAGLVETQVGADVPYQIDGVFLPDNITAIDISPSGEDLFYLQPTPGGVVGVVYNLNTQETKVIFESQAREWRANWDTPRAITLYTAPDINTTGFAYQLSIAGSINKLAEAPGATAHVSPENTYVLLGRRDSSGYRTNLEEIGERTTIMSPPTLGEKCAWAAGGIDVFLCGVPTNFPADPLKSWYQGRFSFTDNLVLFNPTNRNQSALLDDNQLDKGPFDIIDIQTGNSFNTAIFTNKRTGELWGFRL